VCVWVDLCMRVFVCLCVSAHARVRVRVRPNSRHRALRFLLLLRPSLYDAAA